MPHEFIQPRMKSFEIYNPINSQKKLLDVLQICKDNTDWLCFI